MGDSKSNTGRTYSKLIIAKQVIRFMCLFAVVYVLLVSPWPGLGAAYSMFYRKGAAFLFGSFGSKGVVLFRPSGNSPYEIDMYFLDRERISADGKVNSLLVHHTCRYAAYRHIVSVIALILATPIPFRRRAKALFWGLILMHCFIVLKLMVLISYTFNNEPLSLLALNPFSERLLFVTHQLIIDSVSFNFIAPVFIWILVSFRREDWAMLVSGQQQTQR